ncbi:hypothetical protein DRF65_14120 [Chryseobacterium pennae]|uniref:Alpha/beta hydrolase n=1 Tax=Chryseobacterium pennae TaxID=2258962 RepID=A0A3D9C7Y7_9FLAO|nr:alpha/beta hydrolase [Chryseobacterium pennae]REC61864.1 hypothetical protein DRF65_14120 [Chryseobacterium pennae]
MPSPQIDLDKHYRVHVGKKGTFYPDKNPLHNSTTEELDALLKHVYESNSSKLLLYFHGGLVSAEEGLASAGRIVNAITSDTDVHPVCFIWKTDWKRTIIENLDTLAHSDLFRKILVKVLWSAGSTLGIEVIGTSGVARGSNMLTEEEIESELTKEIPFQNYRIDQTAKSANLNFEDNAELSALQEVLLREELTALLNERFEIDTEFQNIVQQEKSQKELELLKPEYVGSETEDGKGLFSLAKFIIGAVNVTIRVIKRFAAKTDHDFHPTVVEETAREICIDLAGNWLWGSMKEKAEFMWKEDDFTTPEQEWHVGYYFINRLLQYQQETGKKLTIDLVGHSAGSIVICHLIKLIANNQFDITFRYIFFLAPACRSDLFENIILNNQHLYTSFKCFTMADELEKMDKVFYSIYPYSLLYLISGILEEKSDTHILGMQRHVTGEYPYNTTKLLRIAEYFNIQGNAIYSITDSTAVDGLRCSAEAHGGFSDDDETVKSIVYLIQN